MCENVPEIYAAAMPLPSDERTELTGMLVDSVGDTMDLLYIDEWSEEINQRLDAYHTGEVEGLTLDEFRASVQQALTEAKNT